MRAIKQEDRRYWTDGVFKDKLYIEDLEAYITFLEGELDRKESISFNSRLRHKREPVEFTCTPINATIDKLNTLMAGLTKFRKESNLKTLDAIRSTCKVAIIELEELKEMNTKLRAWGVEEAELVDLLLIDMENGK